MALNKQQLAIARMCTPSPEDFVLDMATRLAARLGVTEFQATCYCEVGIMLQRFPKIAALLETGAFNWTLVRKIYEDLLAVEDDHVDAVDDAVSGTLVASRDRQNTPTRATVHKKVKAIVEERDAPATPLDDDEMNLSQQKEPAPSLDIDTRSEDQTIFRLALPPLEAEELEKAIRNVASKEKCSLVDSLMKLLRGQVTTQVTLNLYRNVAHEGPDLFAAGSWLSELATEEWMAKVTHLAAPGYDRNQGYAPGDSVTATVEGRDGTCRAPGCNVPARRCQKDHVKRYDHDNPEAGGPTSTANMHLLCAKHHRLKTAGSWDVELEPDGTETWTSHGDGHKVVTTPNGPLGRETFQHRAVRKAKAVRAHNQIKEEQEAEEVKPDAPEDTPPF